ncbi:MAG: hypothetical protein KAR20_29655 [Candidatus Heimdallarchaeota archaeon]|nr:hypothetical protein [Candidatus Heimdallarchaeota archaeon]
MIKIAKEYPIENLIDVNRAGFALCPWHEDTKPSLYCKKNFVHCFACGNSGDSIALYQKLYDVGFREAVKALQ